MNGITYIASVSAMIGDPARANMLYAMKSDGLISAGELAAIAGVAPSTASGHLTQLTKAGLIEAVGLGRRRYYRLVDDRVAGMLDSVESFATWLSQRGMSVTPPDVAMVHARRCLDHLAGALGGAVTNAAIERGFVANTAAGLGVTAAGETWLSGLDIDVPALRRQPRRLLGLCPDWSHGSAHLGGSVGAALLRSWKARDWMRPGSNRYELRVTPKGAAGLRASLGIDSLGLAIC